MASSGFRGILKSASVVGIGMIFSRAVGLFAEIIVARKLPTAEFGAAIFAYTILLTISGIVLIGIPEGFTYYLSIFDERNENNSAFRMVVSGVGILSVVLGITIFCIYLVPFEFVERFGVSNSEWRWIRLLAPIVIAYPISRLSFGIMRGYDRTLPKVVSDDILNKLIALILLGIAIWRGEETFIFLSFYLGQYLFSGLFGGLYATYLLKTKLTLVTGISQFGKEGRKLVSYSWPLALKNVVRRLLGGTDIILIGVLLGSASVGYYRVGYVISQLGMVGLMSLIYLYTPRMARQYDQNNTRKMVYLYRQSTKWATLVTLPLAIPMIYFAEEILQILFGPEYIAGATVLMILALDIIFRVGIGPASATLQAVDRTKADFGTTALMAILNAGLSYILIIRFGIEGAAIGIFISILLVNLIQVILIYRYIKIHPYSVQYITNILLICLLSLPIYFITTNGISNKNIPIIGIPASLFIFTIVFSIIELSVAWFSGILSDNEKQAVRDFLTENRIYLILR